MASHDPMGATLANILSYVKAHLLQIYGTDGTRESRCCESCLQRCPFTRHSGGCAESECNCSSNGRHKRHRAETAPVDSTSCEVDTLGKRMTLDALTKEDWDEILYPVSELRPYLLSASSRSETFTTPSTHHRNGWGAYDRSESESNVLESYVKCRCAELPMRLQAEALLLRKHEHLMRRRMKELIFLSEYVSYCGRNTPTPAMADGDDKNTRRRGSQTAAPLVGVPLTGDIRRLTSNEETIRRQARCQKRITELEHLIRQDALGKVKCCQRMVLLSAVTGCLLNVLQRKPPQEQ